MATTKSAFDHLEKLLHPYRSDLMIRFLLAIALCAVGQAAAAETWSCSVIDDGKPQIIKFTTSKSDTVAMSDWGTRLLKEYGVGDDTNLKLIADTKDALVAVSSVYVNREPATRQEISIEVYAIDKRMRELTITTARTGLATSEIKGNCTR